MRFFQLAIEVCVTGIKRYDYAFKDSDTNKTFKLIRDYHNKYDKNAIRVLLDDKHIGYVKREEAQILSPVLKTNVFYVKKWGVISHTNGYMIVHCILNEQQSKNEYAI